MTIETVNATLFEMFTDKATKNVGCLIYVFDSNTRQCVGSHSENCITEDAEDMVEHVSRFNCFSVSEEANCPPVTGDQDQLAMETVNVALWDTFKNIATKDMGCIIYLFDLDVRKSMWSSSGNCTNEGAVIVIGKVLQRFDIFNFFGGFEVPDFAGPAV